ncbi:endonuclease/exonuclease/phosphatase family protein [Prosthecobacter sp.]|uniref:endonuclease/exonuclease/phosphatase family protein n=1 Tax=Prosthecobacter sp. TaxID=1965333 RepID=UPI00378526BE
MPAPSTPPAPADDRALLLLLWARLASLWQWLRSWFFSSTLLLVAGVLFLAFFIRSRAEDNLLTIFLAYLPVWVLVLPLLGTLLGSLLFLCWRSALLSLSSALFIVIWLGGYCFTSGFTPTQPSGENILSVMTYNRGQGSDKGLAVFASAQRPDIAVFQDAGRRLTQLAALPEFMHCRYTYQSGEYALLSRWPLVENTSLDLDFPAGKTPVWRAGTRSVIDWQGRKIIVYNIHLPTPRDLLYWYAKHGTFLYGILGVIPYTPLYARHQQYLEYWTARVGLAAQLAARVRAESAPVILMGDLNVPPLGRGYGLLHSVLQDAQLSAGTGFGHTFPSNFKSIGRFFAPWIRIDHIFASAHWTVLSCSTPSGVMSQHLPVASLFSCEKDRSKEE